MSSDWFIDLLRFTAFPSEAPLDEDYADLFTASFGRPHDETAERRQDASKMWQAMDEKQRWLYLIRRGRDRLDIIRQAVPMPGPAVLFDSRQLKSMKPSSEVIATFGQRVVLGLVEQAKQGVSFGRIALGVVAHQSTDDPAETNKRIDEHFAGIGSLADQKEVVVQMNNQLLEVGTLKQNLNCIEKWSSEVTERLDMASHQTTIVRQGVRLELDFNTKFPNDRQVESFEPDHIAEYGEELTKAAVSYLERVQA